jgi:outer membrane receptor for ferrienterochelin and colicins
MKGKFLSLGLLLLFFNLVNGQEIKKDSIKTEQLKEVVVTAQYAPTSEKNAVYKVNVINRKTIESKAVTNLTDLLRQELNMDISFNPVFGAGIEINGISKQNIKILVDGVPLIGRVNGVLNLNQINLVGPVKI